MVNYLRISFTGLESSQTEILIAKLDTIGFEGFQEEDSVLHAFIPYAHFVDKGLNNELVKLAQPYSEQIIRPKNWNQEWEENFRPVQIGHFCQIRAPFHPPVPGQLMDVIIAPKMSFGTGHHATTYLMISAMARLDFRNKRILDFGTGTGILAIISEKMGAAFVLALDNDAYCIENANENADINHCFNIEINKADVIPPGSLFDIILANIDKDTILKALQSCKQQMSEQGILIISGLPELDFEAIQSAATDQGLQIFQSTRRDGWICLCLIK